MVWKGHTCESVAYEFEDLFPEKFTLNSVVLLSSFNCVNAQIWEREKKVYGVYQYDCAFFNSHSTSIYCYFPPSLTHYIEIFFVPHISFTIQYIKWMLSVQQNARFVISNKKMDLNLISVYISIILLTSMCVALK